MKYLESVFFFFYNILQKILLVWYDIIEQV